MKGELLTRRHALAVLGLGGTGLLASACARSSPGATRPNSSTTAAEAKSPATACTLMPELTEGPYYLDLKKVRSDITEGRSGQPLVLKLSVVDGVMCTPIEGAAVDIWHADPTGVYSGFGDGGTRTQDTFMRGTQVTDASGAVRFYTMFPGWYAGRAVHVHVKVHVTSSVKHTGQLFFDDSAIDTIYNTLPYRNRPGPDVRNNADGIYRQGGAATIVPVGPDGGRYTGTITLAVRR